MTVRVNRKCKKWGKRRGRFSACNRAIRAGRLGSVGLRGTIQGQVRKRLNRTHHIQQRRVGVDVHRKVERGVPQPTPPK